MKSNGKEGRMYVQAEPVKHKMYQKLHMACDC